MKILVTGASGQVGHSLRTQLSAREFTWLALGRNELDITDADLVDRIILDFKPEVVINAAAYTAVDKAEADQDSAFNVNAQGADNLAKSAREVEAAIFHLSTDYVFSGSKVDPYTENDQADPQNVYGKSKLEGERLVMQKNPRHIILRTSWVFGEKGNNFVKTMLRLGNEHDELKVVNDQQGAPTYTGDIAKTLIFLAEHYFKNKDLPWGIYNFSGSPYTNWYSFASEIFLRAERFGVLNREAPNLKAITSAEYPTPAKRPINSRLDCRKIQDVFGVEPSSWISALNNLKNFINC